MNTLKIRWERLFKRINASGDSDKLFSELVERYSQEHRFYHTLTHIGDCFNEFDEVKDIVSNPNEMEMALWYHDVIYNTHARDNELNSTSFAKDRILNSMKLDEGFARGVYKLIMATRHDYIPRSGTGVIMIDIDLSILGKPKEVFDEYERNIRREYNWVPEAQFNEIRSQILKSFLKREMIYSTSHFEEKYEDQARANLERSLLG